MLKKKKKNLLQLQLHNQSQNQSQKEEEPEEEDEEEDEEEEAPAAEGPEGLVIKGKRKRKPFETRLRNSVYDLRHKYYDLRDYIKWYGLRNRVSIPGDTFSYKRQRYVFVTIVGKHLRVYLNLNPDDYRAKKLVDDVMAKVGLPRPEGDEPKETQKQD